MSKLVRYIGVAVLVAIVLAAASTVKADLIPDVSGTRADGKTVLVFNTVASGTFTLPRYLAGSLEVLVVGGGGGGGRKGGGGGGGGVYYSTNFTPSGSSVSITIGAGGVGGTTGRTAGSQSVFDSVISTGGGIGGTADQGGHSGGNNQPYDAVTNPYPNGFAGGTDANLGGGGGGGGAGQVGGSWTGLKGGNGLAKAIIDETFATTYSVAYDQGYYGGGGGGWYGYNVGGVGGGGDGDDGDSSATAVNGQPGIDGLGGGGGDTRTSPAVGGAGGDGVVIVAYVFVPAPTGTVFYCR